MQVGAAGNVVDLDLIDELHHVYQGSISAVVDPPRAISAIILLTPDNPVWPPGRRVCEGGTLVAYSQFSIQDDPTKFPGLLWLQAAVQIARSYVDAGWPLAIICGAGISRSSLLTAALLMELYQDWDVDAAITKIALKRPVANPNLGFRGGLREWAAWRSTLPPEKEAQVEMTASPALLNGSNPIITSTGGN